MHVYTQLYKEFALQGGRLRLLIDGITETVGGSFLADGSGMTGNEVSRRVEMCAALIMEFHKDMRWPTTRILDELPKALRCKLDGIPYKPTREHHSTWAADNARNLIWLPE